MFSSSSNEPVDPSARIVAGNALLRQQLAQALFHVVEPLVHSRFHGFAVGPQQGLRLQRIGRQIEQIARDPLNPGSEDDSNDLASTRDLDRAGNVGHAWSSLVLDTQSVAPVLPKNSVRVVL
jgi:hypothetical protein